MQVQPWKIHKKGVGFCLAFFQMIATSLLSNKDSSRLNTYARSSIQVLDWLACPSRYQYFSVRSITVVRMTRQSNTSRYYSQFTEIPYWCLISEDSKYFLGISGAFFLEILQFMNAPNKEKVGPRYSKSIAYNFLLMPKSQTIWTKTRR